MSLLTTRQLATMRAKLAQSFDKTCTISTPGLPVDDGAGGETEGTPTAVDVACRKLRLSGDEAAIADRVSARRDWKVVVPHTAIVEPAATIAVDGETHQIVWTNAGESDQLGITCLVRREA